MKGQSTLQPLQQERLMSLDFFRGLTMFLLIGESTHLYELLRAAPFAGTFWSFLGWQLEHHEWNGLHFWDLVQPFFMFIVGVAMPYSFAKRWERGDPWKVTFHHTLRRSFLLLVFGVGLYCISAGRMTFELWNVLAQLSFTYLVAFLLMRYSAGVQIGASLALILLSEVLYRSFALTGFNQPFTPDHNFGSWVDLVLMGKLSHGHWVAFNAVPTSAHTIWGVVAGQWLRSAAPEKKKILYLVGLGAAAVLVGLALDPVTPIIKRICTSSFVIVSGGWCLIALALSYYFVDVLKLRWLPRFFTYVGMNSLFIYLFCHTDGTAWISGIVKPFVTLLFGWSGGNTAPVFVALTAWMGLWGICYWLYRRRIFFKM
jgi:predicted acyltransferase